MLDVHDKLLAPLNVMHIRNVPGPAVRKAAPELSQDKSKEGLGDLYEKEVRGSACAGYALSSSSPRVGMGPLRLCIHFLKEHLAMQFTYS